MYALLLAAIVGRTVTDLVLDIQYGLILRESIAIPPQSLTIVENGFVNVSTLELHLYALEGPTGDWDIIATLSSSQRILDTFTTGALHNILIVCHGSSGSLRRILRYPDVATEVIALQRSIIRLSPQSVTFARVANKADTWAQYQQFKYIEILRDSFSLLYKLNLVKFAVPGGEHFKVTRIMNPL